MRKSFAGPNPKRVAWERERAARAEREAARIKQEEALCWAELQATSRAGTQARFSRSASAAAVRKVA